MCGIAGYFGSRTLDPGRIGTCIGLMGRRGPDHAGYRMFTNGEGRTAYLLHSRLSIIDINERSNQPFNVDRHWAIFNGELYNFIELRKWLEDAGEPFQTNSDTEVFVRAIARRGLDVLSRCEGMWALAFFDESDGSLTLSRDRFGEKPLYLYRSPDGVYFGSEAKFIFALLGRTLPVNRTQIARFLVNGYKSIYKGPETFFEGLEELPPATNLVIAKDGSCSSRSYWRPRFDPRPDMPYEQAVSECRDRLLEAIRLRLRSDVPMAFLMSGGVDSNAIISIAKRVFDYDVHGFTIITTDERYDERAIVEQSVKDLGVKHTTLTVTPDDFMPRLRALVRQHDAPVFTITYYIQWLLMEQVAKTGYRVSFSGTGADELFSGYYDHHLMYLSEIKGTPQYEPAVAAWTSYIKPAVQNPFLSNPNLFDQDRHFRDYIYLDNEVWAGFLVQPFKEAFVETRYASSLLRNRMMNEMFHEGVRVILHEDDLNAMYFSIENRSPFLDRRLFEFCYSIPTRHLIRDGFNKAVLRDAVRGLAPDCVLDQRRKVGFNAPILSFLDPSDPAVLDDLMADGPVFDVIKRDKIFEMLTESSHTNSASKFLFNFVTTKVFLEQFTGAQPS